MNKKINVRKKIFNSLKILAILFFSSVLVASFFSLDIESISGNVAVVPIQGYLTTTESGGFSEIMSSDDIIEQLEKADTSSRVKAIVLDINSPGGSGVAADEISQKIKSIEKPTVAVIRDVGASAAYWIASSSDYVFANRLSITGSIGVIGSYLEFAEFIDEYNVTYRRYVSGDLKDMGSPFKEPSEEEQEVYQEIIDRMEGIFIDEVALNRNISREKVEEMATGQIYLGIEAKELNLVDELGTKEDAYAYLEKNLNMTIEPSEFKKKTSFSDLLTGFTSIKIGKFINPVIPKLQLR